MRVLIVLEEAGDQKANGSLDEEWMTGSSPASECDHLPPHHLEGLLRAAEEPPRHHLDGVVSRINRHFDCPIVGDGANDDPSITTCHTRPLRDPSP